MKKAENLIQSTIAGVVSGHGDLKSGGVKSPIHPIASHGGGGVVRERRRRRLIRRENLA